MKRIIVNHAVSLDSSMRLSPENEHYLRTVMRLSPGDEFVLVDADGASFRAQLMSEHCQILSPAKEPNREPSLKLELCLPLLKGDKTELVVQKSVELGVSGIRFYLAQRSVVKAGANFERKLQRWQQIATGAAQQSRRTVVPCLQGPQALSSLPADGTCLFAWEQESSRGLGDLVQGMQRVRVLVGPEGGLALAEVAVLKDMGYQSITMGPRILRAETAAIALVACVMFSANQMG